MLATTEDGVALSTDGGRKFRAGTGQVLASLSWPTADALYGVDLAGGLHRSANGGTSWKKTGTLPGGQPQDLTAVDAQRVLVTTQDGVYESRDGGRTFTRRLTMSSDGGH